MRIKISPLDKLFSKFIRKRAMARVGGCERCLAPKVSYKELQCSHYHGRGKRSVRWDEDNAAGLCCGCHTYLGANPLEHTEWFKQLIGEQEFDLLLSRARTPARYIDKEAIRLYFEEKLRRTL